MKTTSLLWLLALVSGALIPAQAAANAALSRSIHGNVPFAAMTLLVVAAGATIDSATWAPEAQAYGEGIQNKHGFLTSITRSVTLTTEYPPMGEPVKTVTLSPMAPPRRPCPCGSGRRFKNCCGRRAD